MNLGPDDIKKIAHLARLALNEDDMAPLCKDLTNILHLVEEMNKADTSQIEPMAHPFDEKQPLRQDRVTEENQRQLFQSIAPEIENGLYIVPQVIDSE